jgi:sugar/nucleoside kinase (ribokinase family)
MTTLNQIRSHSPCTDGWIKLLKHLGKTTADDEPLSLLTVLESNGLPDAIWCLRTEPTPERIKRFALAMARRVEHLNPKAKAFNDSTEQYLNGIKAELEPADAIGQGEACAAALCAVRTTTSTAANAATYTAAHAAYAANTASILAGGKAAERPAQEQLFKEIFA